MTSGFSITLKVSTDGDREELIGLLTEYLTSEEAPLLADYGPKAWGGYDGPVIRAIEVTHTVRWSDVPGPTDAELREETRADIELMADEYHGRDIE